MPVTSADVARLAGVSRATVSYVVNGKDARISEETRRVVLDAAASLGYRPQEAGRALVTGKSSIILLSIPQTPNADFLPIIAALQELVLERNMTLLLMPPTPSVDAFVNTIRSVRPHMVITIATLPREHEEALRESAAQWVDIASFTSVPNGLNWQSAESQAQHLVECGFEHLAYARDAAASEDVVQWAREQGFRERCAVLGRPQPLTIAIGRDPQANMHALASLPENTGIAAFNDDTAVDIIYAAHLSERAVPDDLGVIGVDDTSVARTVRPALSSVRFSERSYGQLMDLVVSAPSDHDALREAALATTDMFVVQRGSTMRTQNAGS